MIEGGEKIIEWTRSKIFFDTDNLKENAERYLWARIALGNPSKAPHGSFPNETPRRKRTGYLKDHNKYGELENIVSICTNS